MKKLTTLILAFVLMISLAACGNGSMESGENDQDGISGSTQSGENNQDGASGSNHAAGPGEADGSGDSNATGKTKILSELKSDDGETSFTYKWNGNTLTVEQIINSALSTIIYEYDENGNLMKRTAEATKGKDTSKSTGTYQYDDKGRRTFVSEVVSRSSSDDIKSEYTYTYSDDGKTCTGLSDGSSEIRTYNDKGLLTEVKSTADGGTTYTAKYEYDGNENCTLYSIDELKYSATMTYTADDKLATMSIQGTTFTCDYDNEGYLKSVSFDGTVLKAVWADGTEFMRSRTPAYPISNLAAAEINYHY